MQLAFAHHGVSEIQSVELNLSRTVVLHVIIRTIHRLEKVNKMVVQWAVRNKLERTNGVGNTFEIVTLSMGEVVHGVCVPFGSCPVMRNMYDAIDDWIAEVHVRIGHV